MNKETISPLKILFIRLGKGNEFAQDCIEQSQTLKLNYDKTDHSFCQNKQWDKVEEDFKRESEELIQRGERKRGLDIGGHIKQLKIFYECLDDNVLWVTKYKGSLWWCFAQPEITLVEDNTKTRKVNGKWSNCDLQGSPLLLENSVELDDKLKNLPQWTIPELDFNLQKYIVKLINGKLNPNYWWVNQGQSFEDEFNGGYIRSPQKEKDGGINQCFENMREIKRGDKVASCINGEIKAIGIVKFDVFEESIRAEDIGTEREKGWKAFVDWTLLESPFKIKKNHELIRLEEPPLDKNHNGRQGYIFRISSKLFHIICKSDLEIQEKLIEKVHLGNE
jgi:hypothetical protein